jgi:NADP-dependent 3-hydroxy acid dehydrogenase YdfG
MLQVDILVNNAGLALSLSSVADHDLEVRLQLTSNTVSLNIIQRFGLGVSK